MELKQYSVKELLSYETSVLVNDAVAGFLTMDERVRNGLRILYDGDVNSSVREGNFLRSQSAGPNMARARWAFEMLSSERREFYIPITGMLTFPFNLVNPKMPFADNHSARTLARMGENEKLVDKVCQNFSPKYLLLQLGISSEEQASAIQFFRFLDAGTRCVFRETSGIAQGIFQNKDFQEQLSNWISEYQNHKVNDETLDVLASECKCAQEYVGSIRTSVKEGKKNKYAGALELGKLGCQLVYAKFETRESSLGTLVALMHKIATTVANVCRPFANDLPDYTKEFYWQKSAKDTFTGI